MLQHRGKSYFRQVNLIVPGVAGTGNTQQTFTFPDQPDLRYARMQNLVFLTQEDVAYVQPQQIAAIPAVKMPLVSFSFETNDPDDLLIKDPSKPNARPARAGGDAGRFSKTLQTIQWLPASLLHITNQNTAGVPSVWEMLGFKDTYVIWQKSQINLGVGGLANTTDVAICLGVWYTFVSEEGREIYPRN